MKYVVVNQHTADGPEVAINLEQVIFAEPFPGKIIKVRFTDGKELSVYGGLGRIQTSVEGIRDAKLSCR